MLVDDAAAVGAGAGALDVRGEERGDGGHVVTRHALGGIGTALVLAAYVAVTGGYTVPSDALYLAANLVGGAALVWYTLKCRAWASVFYNSVWVAISVVGLIGGER